MVASAGEFGKYALYRWRKLRNMWTEVNLDSAPPGQVLFVANCSKVSKNKIIIVVSSILPNFVAVMMRCIKELKKILGQCTAEVVGTCKILKNMGTMNCSRVFY
ncbi:hypothetical protein OWV82_025035 [Melia azedarach]|uniref:Uncharacterized protein n=1 Tax=Melia azedarach TaxID=155640 RepID=A0ACC1WS91_MELAZ|nr:hypothetical protein OWV82_025035 [Melia azedarach]